MQPGPQDDLLGYGLPNDHGITDIVEQGAEAEIRRIYATIPP